MDYGDKPAARQAVPSYTAEVVPFCSAIDMPGSREIAREGESALLVPPRDPAALAAAILRLAHDPALRARLGAGGRALVEHTFSEDRIAAATLALWRRLLDPDSAGGKSSA